MLRTFSEEDEAGSLIAMEFRISNDKDELSAEQDRMEGVNSSKYQLLNSISDVVAIVLACALLLRNMIEAHHNFFLVILSILCDVP